MNTITISAHKQHNNKQAQQPTNQWRKVRWVPTRRAVLEASAECSPAQGLKSSGAQIRITISWSLGDNHALLARK
jgi:hypothetical protein